MTEASNGSKLPDHTLPSDYSDVQPKSYDPDFISHISSQMQVPHRIGVSNGHSDPPVQSGYGEMNNGYTLNGMTVPDRILVAGDNQHIGMKSDLSLHLRSDQPMNPEAMSYVGLITPPRTLTMEESFPIVEPVPEKRAVAPEVASHQALVPTNGHVVPPSPYDPGVNPNDSLLLNEEDEVTYLRTQMSKLARRVNVIEEEHKRRSQRELVLYPVVFGYILWKVLGWLARDGR